MPWCLNGVGAGVEAGAAEVPDGCRGSAYTAGGGVCF